MVLNEGVISSALPALRARQRLARRRGSSWRRRRARKMPGIKCICFGMLVAGDGGVARAAAEAGFQLCIVKLLRGLCAARERGMRYGGELWRQRPSRPRRRA